MTPLPCESKPDIEKIKDEQHDLKTDIAVMKDAVARQGVDQAAFIKESREVIQLLRESAIENREHHKQAKEIQDVVFKKIRDIDVRVKKTEDFITTYNAKGILLRDIRVTVPVVCTLIATGVAVWSVLH